MCDDWDPELACISVVDSQVNCITVAEYGWKLKLRVEQFSDLNGSLFQARARSWRGFQREILMGGCEVDRSLGCLYLAKTMVGRVSVLLMEMC